MINIDQNSNICFSAPAHTFMGKHKSSGLLRLNGIYKHRLEDNSQGRRQDFGMGGGQNQLFAPLNLFIPHPT